MCPISDPESRRRGGPVVAGMLLVAAGILAMLDNLGVVEFYSALRTYWPVLLIAWGGARLVLGPPSARWFGAIGAIVGIILLGNRLLLWRLTIGGLWPLLLIVLGIRLMTRRHGFRRYSRVQMELNQSNGPSPVIHRSNARGSGAGEPDTSSTLREFALLGGVERRNTSQTFRGGEVTAVLGGVEVDLSECRMSEDSARVEVFAMLGGVSFRIPRDWTVESDVSAILGGFQDMSSPPVDASGKRLILSGQAVLGGIEVKN
jgi:hypothetical protein